MINIIFVSTLFFGLNAYANSDFSAVHIDDSDLGGPPLKFEREVALDLVADRMVLTEKLGIQVFIETKTNGPAEITGLQFKITENSGVCVGVAELKDGYFDVTNEKYTYRVRFETKCEQGTLKQGVQLYFKEESDGGQALGIFRIAMLAEKKLDDAIGLKFWKKKIKFSWPGDGDYYSFGEIHITKGFQWDVVGHELGHAIYDLGKIGKFGGGQHLIDRCYSEALSLSEGWASYFSAWLSIALKEADAKFTYMVPRRAPIRFEAIPTDVCAGPDNEWRTIGFFWDFIDLHEDDETANEVFARLWNALLGTNASGPSEAARLLVNAGFDSKMVDLIWYLNYRVKR